LRLEGGQNSEKNDKEGKKGFTGKKMKPAKKSKEMHFATITASGQGTKSIASDVISNG